MRLPPKHVHRMGISNVPIGRVLMELRGRTVVGCWLIHVDGHLTRNWLGVSSR